ncbi:hypothetical protein N9383_05220 [Granulosicoccus sp.]|nr:hypothetical protein [Granulosicoccus sp.]
MFTATPACKENPPILYVTTHTYIAAVIKRVLGTRLLDKALSH